MSVKKYLTASGARRLVEKRGFPLSQILDTLIKKVEVKIRIVATMKQCQTLWSVPFVYASVPAYDTVKMTHAIAEHLKKQGFYIKMLGTTTLWISWLYATDETKQKLLMTGV